MYTYKQNGTSFSNYFNAMAYCIYDIENNKRTVKDYELFGIAHVLGIEPSAAGAAIATVGVTNGIPEAILSAVITIPVITTLKKIKK